jgi:putative O-methyltransferase
MPARVAKSYEKFNYLLRPSKQVERKLFIETFHHLCEAGYKVSNYTYVGLGSVFYADFIMFHKYLYLDDMVCAEWGDIHKRMRFNKPFDFVKLVMKPVSEVVSTLSRKAKYLVWLDYDRPLDSEVLEDLDAFMQVLSAGSILLLTVEAEPRLDSAGFEDLSLKEREERLITFFREEFGPLLVDDIKRSDLSPRDLAPLVVRILRSQIANSLVSRLPLRFHQLFNFVYADGAQMLTVGGIIDHPAAEGRLRKAGILGLRHVRRDEIPEFISVPPLTVREKEWIDGNLISAGKKLSKNLGLDPRLLKNYIKFYKYYPTYHETLI